MSLAAAKVCPYCGSGVALEYPDGLDLPPIRFKIFETVRRSGSRGIMPESLEEIVYADDPNGGPLGARKSIQVSISVLNKTLVSWGLRIRSGARGQPYKLERIVDPPKRVYRKQLGVF